VRALLLVPLLLLACRSGEPPVATPAGGVAGDGTIAGEPAGVPRAATAPTIDGKLDEPAWRAAVVLGPFVDPSTGEDPGAHPVAGFARATWDERHLYLAFVIRDAAPRSPFARDEVDPHIWSKASGVEVMLQPGDPGDNRSYHEVQVDVAGAVWDTRFDDYNQPITGEGTARRYGHEAWASGLTRAVTVGDGHYVVELALPFAALAPARVPLPPRPGDVWRMNLYSFRDGQRHALAWSPLRRQGNFHKASRFGRIRFE
jgi:hypothetical protein